MKALKILKKLRDSINGDCYMGQEQELEWCDESIAELEALQAPKMCDGCKFLVHFGVKNSNRVVCNYPFACIRRSKHEDYYEPKER